MAKAPQKSKEAKAKAASGGGKKSKKKWSKGKSRDKLQNMCLFDKPTYDRVLKEVPNYKVKFGTFSSGFLEKIKSWLIWVLLSKSATLLVLQPKHYRKN